MYNIYTARWLFFLGFYFSFLFSRHESTIISFALWNEFNLTSYYQITKFQFVYADFWVLLYSKINKLSARKRILRICKSIHMWLHDDFKFITSFEKRYWWCCVISTKTHKFTFSAWNHLKCDSKRNRNKMTQNHLTSWMKQRVNGNHTKSC